MRARTVPAQAAMALRLRRCALRMCTRLRQSSYVKRAAARRRARKIRKMILTTKGLGTLQLFI